jgi:hypothetical protein
MLKNLIASLLFFTISNLTYSQLISGDLMESGRKMETKFNFEIKDKYSGFQSFELAVNPLGKVIGIKNLDERGGIISTPAKVLATNKLYELKFESGAHYPKFHHVKVKVNFVKLN